MRGDSDEVNGMGCVDRSTNECGTLAGHQEAKVVIGEQHFGDGSTKPLYGGNQANVAIWRDYIIYRHTTIVILTALRR